MNRIPKAVLLGLLLVGLPSLSFPDDNKTASSTEEKQDKQEVVQPSGKMHLRLGTVTVGRFYSHFSGPAFYPYDYGYWRYPLFWDPWWNWVSPLYYPGYFTGFAPGPDKGEVRLSGAPKKAAVYIDGAYAGTADRLKNLWLDPGAYDLVVTAEPSEPFRQRIYVLTGKTLKLSVNLAPEKTEVNP